MLRARGADHGVIVDQQYARSFHEASVAAALLLAPASSEALSLAAFSGTAVEDSGLAPCLDSAKPTNSFIDFQQAQLQNCRCGPLSNLSS